MLHCGLNIDTWMSSSMYGAPIAFLTDVLRLASAHEPVKVEPHWSSGSCGRPVHHPERKGPAVSLPFVA